MVTQKRSREAVFRAIADPTRREILGLLRANSQTVGELAHNFRMSRPAVSKHVRVLKSAGLIAMRDVGATRVCELNAKPLLSVRDWIADYDVFWSDSLHGLKRYVERKR